MSLLVLQAYLSLIRFDRLVRRKNFVALYNSVRSHPISRTLHQDDSVEAVCGAVEMACIWYWKEVLCLQRSAATTCLLRRYGVPAQLIIGAHRMPFRAHAWVEVNGQVVNDKFYVGEKYAVLDRW